MAPKTKAKTPSPINKVKNTPKKGSPDAAKSKKPVAKKPMGGMCPTCGQSM